MINSVLFLRSLHFFELNNTSSVQIKMQQRLQCTFNITLLNISYKSDEYSLKPPQKSILIKIGTKSVKCQHLNQPAILRTQSFYSNSTRKFKPLKGIIKVYDVTEEGNHIISSVGAFNTDDLLCIQGVQKTISKDVGPIILQLLIKTSVDRVSHMSDCGTSQENGDNLSQSLEQLLSQRSWQSEKKQQTMNKSKGETMQIVDNCRKEHQIKNSNILIIEESGIDLKSDLSGNNQDSRQNSSINNENRANLMEVDSLINKLEANKAGHFTPNFTKSSKTKVYSAETKDNGSQSLTKVINPNRNSQLLNQSIIKNKSQVSMSELTFHELYQESQKSQLSLIGQELIEERRKNSILEQKLEKNRLKIQSYKRRLNQAEAFSKQWGKICQNFLNSLVQDSYDQFIIELNRNKQIITFRYNPQLEAVDNYIMDLLTFMSKCRSTDKAQNKKVSDKSITVQIENVYQENIRYRHQIKDSEQTIHLLKKKYEEAQRNLANYSSQINDKNEEIYSLQIKEAEMRDSIKNIEGVNLYLKEKDQQMEYIISTKENTIDNLRKMLTVANNELDELQDQNIGLKKTLRNCELMIQELKEEIAHRDDTLEMYEEKYGAIKFQKNRELQNQINDCLRWLNQESKYGQSSLEETQRSDITIRKDRTLSNVVKNNDKLYGLSYEDVVKVREELSGLMEQVKEFQTKLQREEEFKSTTFSSNLVNISS